MQLSSKNIIGLIGILLTYIVLAGLGIYSAYGLFFFPILSIPLTVCLIKESMPKGIDFLFCSTAIIGIFMLTGTLEALLVFVVAVCIPAYIIRFMYKKEFSLPHMIIYTALGIVVGVFGYGLVMSYLGINYGEVFIQSADEIKQIYFDTIENLKTTLPAESINQLGDIKGMVSIIIELMKKVYPALIVVMSITLAAINLLLVQLILRLKKLKGVNLKQLVSFRLSKWAILILTLAMMTPFTPLNENVIAVTLAANVLIVLQYLLQLAGALALVGIISKGPLHIGMKVMLYILISILFIIYPSMLVLFGCFDTIFNYRKTDIIV